MQDNPDRKRPGCCADRIYAERQCEDCPVVFQPASSQQVRCEDCQPVHTRKINRERAASNRAAATPPRYCADCSAEIPKPKGSGRLSKRCEECREAYWTAFNRDRNKARTVSGERKVYDARYRENNGETIRANNQRYKAAHPETDQAAIHRRRQRSEVGMDDLDRALSASYRVAIRDDPCFYCGAAAAEETDHFFPLSKGGSDKFYNLYRSCRRCNRGSRGKGIMCGTAFMLRRGFPLAAAA